MILNVQIYMNRILLYLFGVSLLALFVHGFQLKHFTINQMHLASDQEKMAYIQKLMELQNDLEAQVNDLITLADQNANEIEKFNDAPDIQREEYEKAFEIERRHLYIMQSSLSLPLADKSWGCQNLTKEEAESINNQIIQTQKKIHELQTKLSTQPECPVTDQTEKQIQFLNFYINHLSEELENLCEKPASFKTFYTPFPDSNYTYGADGESGYKQKIKEALDGGFKIGKCQQDNPYPQNNSCIQCPDETVFDLTQSQCLKCPEGYSFSKDLHRCNKIPFNIYPGVVNFQGQIPEADPNRQTCPEDAAFWNGQECVSCDSPSFFNFGTNKCEQCEEGLFFNTETKLCGYEAFNTNPKGQNICCGTIVADPNLETCPEQTPYYNGKQCIACDSPSYFSLQTHSCAFCPDGEGFSLFQHRCRAQKYLEPIYNSTIDKDIQNYKGVPPIIDDEYQNIINCARSTPYYDGTQCTKCQLPSYFSFDEINCMNCPSQEKFDLKYHKCIHISSDKFNSNMTEINNFKGRIHPFNPDLQTCPGQSPFFNGLQCVPCQIPKYVDFDHSKCSECEQGYIFDLFNRQCIIDPPGYYTNLDAGNIYYNGDFGLIEKQIDNVKETVPNAQQCDINIPYYNALRGKCQQCPEEKPLFDYKYNMCIKCPEDSDFNEDRHICIANGNVSPTIQRMWMNTIGIL